MRATGPSSWLRVVVPYLLRACARVGSDVSQGWIHIIMCAEGGHNYVRPHELGECVLGGNGRGTSGQSQIVEKRPPTLHTGLVSIAYWD